VAFQPLALGVQCDQLLCHLLGRALARDLAFVQSAPPIFRELNRRVLAAADVFCYQVKLCRGDIKAVRSGVSDFYIILFNTVNRHLENADITPDPVVLVYDEVTGRQIREALQPLAV
jgi:hypothetical protein